MKIKVKTPAKINLSLKVGPVRTDGFHPIESIMQSVSLFDYLVIELMEIVGDEIILEGNSAAIPYDERNIVFRAAKLFFDNVDAGTNYGVKIYIEKNIPVCAGLAGGSTNAAGTIYGLNKLLNEPFSRAQLHKMCVKLGSDLNFCLEGGRQKCTGRGEILEKLPFEEFALTIVKPKKLEISAKEAYQKFDALKSVSNLPNDLEFALLSHYESEGHSPYKQLQELHGKGFQMSGSGPSFFILENKLPAGLIKNPDEYEIFEGLKAVPYGVCEV